MRRGHISARGRGYRIEVRYGFDKTTGKYLKHSEQFNGTRSNAEKRCTQLLNDIDSGKFVPPSKITIEKYLEMWLEDFIKPNFSVKTYGLYSYICHKHLIPEIGILGLSELKIERLQKLYSKKKADGLSSRTVQIVHVTMHKALKQAVKIGYLQSNVADFVDKPPLIRHEIQPISNKNMQLILERARQTDYYALFYTYLFTGMRRSEVLALRMKDVDLLEMRVSINRSMQVSKGEVSFKAPKTPGSRRTVPLTPSNAVVLREYIAQKNAKRVELGLKKLADEDLLFTNGDLSPFLPESVSHAWMKIARFCGLEGVRLHDCRHTFATNHLSIGTHPKIVAGMLGHAKTTTTLDMYSHKVPGLEEKAARALDEALLPKLTEEVTKEN